MKDTISLQERRLLATMILSGLCANPDYPYHPSQHVMTAVSLLDELLSELPNPSEVKSIKELS